jgi:biopolymer transport protein TolQ
METPEIVVTTHKLSFWDMITAADIIGQMVMLILVTASIVSWAIIVGKYYNYKFIREKITAFENLFWSGQVLDALYEKVKQSIDNPMASIFVAAMSECKRHDSPKTREASIKVGLKERIGQAMYLVRNRESEKLEKNLGFLAIVGSTAIFVGLFGTVCGIMHSFQSIAGSNNTSLAVVAPGIAEALLVTAMGLVAAIPAMVAYNLLVSQVNSINNKLEDFSYELHTLLSRAIDEEKL